MVTSIGHFILAVALASGQHSASDASAPNASDRTASGQAEASQSKDAEVRCKYEKVLGSKIPKKICMTEFDWQERQRIIEEEMSTLSKRNSTCGSAGPC